MSLQEIEAIKRLKYKYMRCIDRKEWDELEECFTDDATAAYSGGKYSYTGRDAILKFLSEAMGAPSFHSTASSSSIQPTRRIALSHFIVEIRRRCCYFSSPTDERQSGVATSMRILQSETGSHPKV